MLVMSRSARVLVLSVAFTLGGCGASGGAAPTNDGGSGGHDQASGGRHGSGGATAAGGRDGSSGDGNGDAGRGGSSGGRGGSDPGDAGGGGAGGWGAAGAGGSDAGGSNRGGSGGIAGPDAGPADAPPGACVPGSGSEEVGAASVLDRRTCLLWQRAAGATLTNKQAARHCADLVLDGYTDWRVPAPEELATWPRLVADSTAYITNPIYIPAGASEPDGCTGNSHSCNLAEYNLGTHTCAWQGVGFAGRTVCVRGAAAAGTLPAAFAAKSCSACKEHLTGEAPEFKIADCLPYAQ
jgi:hypothetical protein